jgi:hypothetical protein
MGAALANVVLGLIGIHFFGYIFCRYGISGDTKCMRFALREHWRIWTTGLVGWVVVMLIMLLVFPHDRLKSQISLAGVFGCFPGILFGCGWYVMSKGGLLTIRLKGLFPLVLGTAMGIGLGVFGIIMVQKQQEALRFAQSFSNKDILQVDADLGKLGKAAIVKSNQIEAIKSMFADAEIYYGRRNADIPTVQIKIQSGGNIFEYEGFTPMDNGDDVILKIPALGRIGDRYGIRLPGLKRWLDENILSKQKNN